MLETWTPEWSNPVFSIQERDRRWGRVRELMARAGIDVIACLPSTNNHDRGQQDVRYLTQLGENSDEVTVVFPREGEVTAWLSRGGVWPSSNWFTDMRAGRRGSGGRTVVERLKEMGFERGTIGIPSLSGSLLAHIRQAEGEANWQSVEIIKQAFPNARVVSACDVLGEARYVKSEEEIEFIRKGTEVAEATMRAAIDSARAGVSERHVFGRMMFANADAGGSFPPMLGWISGPFGNTYHRLEQPSFRKLQLGDVMLLEMEGRWGGYAAQIDDTFSIGPAHQDLKDGMKLSFESFNRVFEAMRPGVTVGELIKAGDVSGMNGRGTASLTMHGRGTGDDGPLVTGNRSPELLALQLLEGCSMVIKPSARVDGKPDHGRWGETVVIRKNGAERLGTRPQELWELT
jgi:Xaa-Pro aminopeptidase